MHRNHRYAVLVLQSRHSYFLQHSELWAPSQLSPHHLRTAGLDGGAFRCTADELERRGTKKLPFRCTSSNFRYGETCNKSCFLRGSVLVSRTAASSTRQRTLRMRHAITKLVTIFVCCFSLPAMADDQSDRATEIEVLSDTFGSDDPPFPQTAILIDGCFISFVEYFAGGSSAVITTDDLSLIPLGSNNSGYFTGLDRSLLSDADWLSLDFATSESAVRTQYHDIPPIHSPREILSSPAQFRSHIDWARYLNYWYPDTERVETIAAGLVRYQSNYCKPIS